MASLALAGCGAERQDEDEPEGEFTLQVVDASFPERQSTAQSATLRISVRNTDDRDLPNLAVTIRTTAPGGGEVASAFGQSSDDPRLADDDRPIWVVDDGPTGGASAYTNTWSVGRSSTSRSPPIRCPRAWGATARSSAGSPGRSDERQLRWVGRVRVHKGTMVPRPGDAWPVRRHGGALLHNPSFRSGERVPLCTSVLSLNAQLEVRAAEAATKRTVSAASPAR